MICKLQSFNKIYQSIFKERIIILLPNLRISKQIFQKVFVKKHADGESEEEEIVNRSCLWLCFSICFYSVLKLN